MSNDRVAMTAALLAFSAVAMAGCRGPDHPRVPDVAPETIDVTRTGATLRAVASDGDVIAVAYTRDQVDGVPAEGAAPIRSVVELRRGTTTLWSTELEGRVQHLALGPPPLPGTPIRAKLTVYATLSGAGSLGGQAVRGEPASAVVALNGDRVEWVLPLESNDWVVVTGIATSRELGVVVVGSFAGSLRAGEHVVSSGGSSDGFILAVRGPSSVRWLQRMGGSGTDDVRAVAVRGTGASERIAIAGTYQNTAEIGGVELPAFDERTPNPDGYVALLDNTGARLWAQTFGGQHLESAGGVALDDDGRVVLAANVRGEVSVSGRTLTAKGPGAGLVAWWEANGTPRIAELVDSEGFDSLWGITAVGGEIVVGGELDRRPYIGAWNARAKEIGRFELDESRATIVALGGVPGGFLAAVLSGATAKALVRPVPRQR